LDRLIREAAEARLQEAVLAAAGEELLDRARDLSQAVQQPVAHLAEGRRPDAYPKPAQSRRAESPAELRV
jgi:hypothetical protein